MSPWAALSHHCPYAIPGSASISHRYCHPFSSHLTAPNNQANKHLTDYSKTSSSLGNKHLGASCHPSAIMPPRRGRGGRAGGTPGPAAPDPSPRAQRTPGPSRFSTAYGSPAQFAPSHASTESSHEGIRTALRSVQDHNPDVQRSKATSRNRGSAAPPAAPPALPPALPPAVPPQPPQPPPGPANNNQRMFLDFPLTMIIRGSQFVYKFRNCI